MEPGSLQNPWSAYSISKRFSHFILQNMIYANSKTNMRRKKSHRVYFCSNNFFLSTFVYSYVLY